jgi:hypothetical protein
MRRSIVDFSMLPSLQTGKPMEAPELIDLVCYFIAGPLSTVFRLSTSQNNYLACVKSKDTFGHTFVNRMNHQSKLRQLFSRLHISLLATIDHDEGKTLFQRPTYTVVTITTYSSWCRL